MNAFDVVIVGAGPAGGQCARTLSKHGHRVLLIEKAKTFLENNYSSGGSPQSILTDFDLPESVVGTHWNKLNIHSSRADANWTSPSPLGPILNFDALRVFLSKEACQHGATLHLDCHYLNHRILTHGVEISLKDCATSDVFNVTSTVLVDATGSERKVFAPQNKKETISATGIEYHVQVDKDIYEQYAHSMNFYLGHQWMPQGYAWIFPKSQNQLKVGIIRYFQNKQYVPHLPSYKPYLEKILGRCGDYEIIDKHGKTIQYSTKQNDRRYEGPVIAIGDAISAINPLGWEGIRHGMASGQFAAHAIDRYLKREINDFKSYDRDLKHYFGMKWRLSELMMSFLFKNKKDTNIDAAVECFSLMNNDQIMDVIFNYRYHHTLKSFFFYLFK